MLRGGNVARIFQSPTSSKNSQDFLDFSAYALWGNRCQRSRAICQGIRGITIRFETWIDMVCKDIRMKRLLYVLPFFLISCEKEVIEPAKYIEDYFGKPAVVDKVDKKPNKLRLRKRKRKHEKINKSSYGVSNRSYKHDSGRYSRCDSCSIRNLGLDANISH